MENTIKSIKYLLFIILAIQMIDLSSADNSTSPGMIVTVEDVLHISDKADTIELNETIGNYTGSELNQGQYIKIGEAPGTFHEWTITNGSFNPDCTSCHNLGGLAAKQIDVNAFKKSTHANLNNGTNSAGVIDPINKACWACHGNGTQPDIHPEEYLSPGSCASCHSFNTSYNATRVSGHTRAGEKLTITTSCETCHGNAIVKNAINNTKANVSHYAGKILYNSTDCLSCHANQVNATLWGNASQVYSHDKNGSCTDCHAAGQIRTLHDINLTVPAERTCIKCHTTQSAVDKYGAKGVIRTHYPQAPEELANTTQVNASFTCELCHNITNSSLHNSSLTKDLITRNNSPQGYCYQCHGADGKYPYKPSVQIPRLIHGNLSEHIAVGMKITCETCHDSNRMSRFHRPSVAWDRPVGRIVDSKSAQCTDCHNTHIEQPIPNITCSTCHADYDASHYSSLVIEKVNKTLTCGACHNEIKNQFHNLTGPNRDPPEPVIKTKDIRILSCDSCHNATGKEKFHYSKFPTGSIQSPGWSNWSNGSRVNKCSDCHVKYGGKAPFNATNLTNPQHRAATNCIICHGGDTPIALHVLQRSNAAPYIRDIILIPQKTYTGKNSSLNALAVSGWDANITNVEYFIDIVDTGGKGRNLTLGKELAGGQVREAFADIDTSGLKEGTHIVSIHAQDSKGRWGDIQPVPLVINKSMSGWHLFEHQELMFLIMGTFTLFYIYRRIK